VGAAERKHTLNSTGPEMNHFWDERYSSGQYIYGKEPNGFFASELRKRKPGRILLPGEGEGRNAVHAARSGWKVDAFDQSQVGREKALAFASEEGVGINYTLSTLDTFPFLPNHYDSIGLIFFHAFGPDRRYLHRQAVSSLKPGGFILLEAFHKDQLGKNSGGPRVGEMLFDEDMLLADFTEVEPLILEKQSVVLNEGAYHQGEASVISFTGLKRS
jgi:SAM-dependent methyltransferase